MTAFKDILVARTDRLGDVLLSLPALRYTRVAFPEARVRALLLPEWEPLLSPLLRQWHIEVVPYSPTALPKADAALVLWDAPGLARGLARAGVAVRIGPYSKLRSFFWFTGGLRQRRGQGLVNEAQYGLELARYFAAKHGGVAATKHGGVAVVEPEPAGIELPVHAPSQEQANAALHALGIAPGAPFWIVHSGMGGSALNLSPGGYVRLIQSLQAVQDGPVVLSLGPAAADLRQVEAIVDKDPSLRVLPQVPLAALAEVFRKAQLVVAPSTGPLHLAHYVGARTLGLFPPVRSQSPRRWAPWGGSGQSEVFSPPQPCPGKRACLGPKCSRFNCLDALVAGGLPSPWNGVLSAGGE